MFQACNKNEMNPLHKHLPRNILSVGTNHFQNRFLITSLPSWFHTFNWKWSQTWMNKSKVSLTLNDLYDTTCMTHNQFSNFHCVYTIIQVVHTKFIKVVLTEYLAFNSLRKMIQEQAAAAIIITLISEKNKSRKKRKKKKSLC